MKPLVYHESKQRGSTDFPLDYHYLEEAHPRYQMPCHWHEEYEIIHVLSGTFELTLDGQPMTLSAEDAVFIGAERLHGGIPHGCVYECVVLDLRLLLKCNDHCKRQVGDVLGQRICPRTLYPAGDEIARDTLLPMFRALREKSAGYELITLGCLFQFLGRVYEKGAYAVAGQEGESGKKALQLKRVFEMIESEYASPLTLSALAASAHMTPKYFCRFFKETTHRTPINYLNYYRVETACDEIAATDKSLTEIALDAGFSNLNYFIRQFRKYKGVTPGQYLSALREGK